MKKLHLRVYLSVLALSVMLSVALTCLLMPRQPVAALPARSEAVLVEAADPVTRFRTEREQLRQRQKSQLNDIIHSPSGDPEAVAMAQRQLVGLLEREGREQSIEGVLGARGLDGAMAVLSDQSATILLRRADAPTQREIAVILELVMRETGLTGGNVKIVPVS